MIYLLIILLFLLTMALLMYRTSGAFLSRKFSDVYRKFDDSISEAALFVGAVADRVENLHRELEQKEELFKSIIRDIQARIPVFKMLEELSDDEEFYGVYFAWKKGWTSEDASVKLGVPLQKVNLLYRFFEEYSREVEEGEMEWRG